MGFGTGVKQALNTKLDPSRRSAEAQDFEKGLRHRIVGQDHAIEKMVEVYQMFQAGLNPPGRPIANMLFLGPTGTGKTHVVEAAAEVLFGDERACIKIDCAEFQHSHEIAKLIGSPPGYLGHRETHPLLTQEALNQWHTEKLRLSLLLFDEIEKASDALWQLLLGILDKGTLTLGDNRRVDLSQCIIVLTSNLGATQMADILGESGLGFSSGKIIEATTASPEVLARLDRAVTEAIKRKFSPEFRNRIDKQVVFKPLYDEHLKQILQIELGLLQRRILQATGSAQFVFSVTQPVKDMLLAEGTDRKYGARHLKRAIERLITFPVANLVSTGQVKLGDYIQIDLDGSECTFTKLAEGALVPVLLEKYGPEFIVPPRPVSGGVRATLRHGSPKLSGSTQGDTAPKTGIEKWQAEQTESQPEQPKSEQPKSKDAATPEKQDPRFYRTPEPRPKPKPLPKKYW